MQKNSTKTKYVNKNTFARQTRHMLFVSQFCSQVIRKGVPSYKQMQAQDHLPFLNSRHLSLNFFVAWGGEAVASVQPRRVLQRGAKGKNAPANL